MQTPPGLDFAPIQGVTNAVYRRAFHAVFSGIDRDFAPFIRVRPVGRPSPGLKNRLPPFDAAQPLVPQILSNQAGEFINFDRWVGDLGYPEFNWNLGCPVRMVTLKQRGAGLLPHPDRIRSILDEVLPKLACRLSLKLRLGLEDPRELAALIPVLNQYPLAELIIHPRTGAQLYRGRADLDAFEACRGLSVRPVVYNGDIFNLAAYRRAAERLPQTGRWMLGRGVLVNPFLPAQIKGAAPPSDKLERLRRFHDLYAEGLAKELSGPSHITDKLKEYWSYAQHLVEGGPEFFRRACKARRHDAFRDGVERFFAERPAVKEHVDIASEAFRE